MTYTTKPGKIVGYNRETGYGTVAVGTNTLGNGTPHSFVPGVYFCGAGPITPHEGMDVTVTLSETDKVISMVWASPPKTKTCDCGHAEKDHYSGNDQHSGDPCGFASCSCYAFLDINTPKPKLTQLRVASNLLGWSCRPIDLTPWTALAAVLRDPPDGSISPNLRIYLEELVSDATLYNGHLDACLDKMRSL